ncbi:hypothetical protein JTE90_016241 [Oedothorax gibbosus]|uniref:Ionotropic glutamate receptor L-glutamate and glycine-binding domain-containing protein n=1 Tax=Oedothorax gibbosus TaxID=931172 RepID=A0AAV6VTS1_9ARAC|nr:hypothetical protein JTE90_016241 [Oedothorax gibbosus]
MIPSRLRVSLIPDPYFTLINESLPGYQRASGANGEFLNIISKILGFQYDFVYPEGVGEYDTGVQKEDGNWTGIIGILARREADFSINQLSMEFHRQEVVDFGTVYSTEEVIYVIEKPKYHEIPLFGFLYPFDFTVWIQNFKELYSAAEKGTHQCFYYENGYVLDELKHSKTEYLNNLGNVIIKNSWYLDASDYPYLDLVTENSESFVRISMPAVFHGAFYQGINSPGRPAALRFHKNFTRRPML